MTIWCFLILFVALVFASTIGYAMGVKDGYKNGFAEGAEDQKLKSIDKLEPEWGAEKMTDNETIKEATEAYEQNLSAGVYVGDLLRIIKQRGAEIERKTTECERLEMYMDELVKQKLNQAKAEAIKEFLDLLKENSTDIVLYGEIIPICRAERLAKELVGESNV